MKARNQKKILQKLVHKYRLIIIDESTLEQKVKTPLNLLSLMFLIAFLILIGFLFSFLVIKYAPKIYFNNDSNKDSKYILLSKELKNVKSELESNALYISNIQAILSGKLDEIPAEDTLVAVGKIASNENIELHDSLDSLLRKKIALENGISEKELQDFTSTKTMQSPIEGDIVIDFDIKKHPFVTIKASQNDSVQIIDNGKVLIATTTKDTRSLLIVSHKGGFLSVYKNLSLPQVVSGDPVQKGQKVATVNLEGQKEAYLTFELWLNGVITDPNIYIDF